MMKCLRVCTRCATRCPDFASSPSAPDPAEYRIADIAAPILRMMEAADYPRQKSDKLSWHAHAEHSITFRENIALKAGFLDLVSMIEEDPYTTYLSVTTETYCETFLYVLGHDPKIASLMFRVSQDRDWLIRMEACCRKYEWRVPSGQPTWLSPALRLLNEVPEREIDEVIATLDQNWRHESIDLTPPGTSPAIRKSVRHFCYEEIEEKEKRAVALAREASLKRSAESPPQGPKSAPPLRPQYVERAPTPRPQPVPVRERSTSRPPGTGLRAAAPAIELDALGRRIEAFVSQTPPRAQTPRPPVKAPPPEFLGLLRPASRVAVASASAADHAAAARSVSPVHPNVRAASFADKVRGTPAQAKAAAESRTTRFPQDPQRRMRSPMGFGSADAGDETPDEHVMAPPPESLPNISGARWRGQSARRGRLPHPPNRNVPVEPARFDSPLGIPRIRDGIIKIKLTPVGTTEPHWYELHELLVMQRLGANPNEMFVENIDLGTRSSSS